MPRKTFVFIVVFLCLSFSSLLLGTNAVEDLVKVRANMKSPVITYASHAPGHSVESDWVIAVNEAVKVQKDQYEAFKSELEIIEVRKAELKSRQQQIRDAEVVKRVREALKKETMIPVLMYHHFQRNESSSTVVDPTIFKEQMTYLKSNGYNTINDEELISFLNGKGELPDKPVLITMDDGYESNYTLAYPVLKELNMKATIYVIGKAMREHRDDPTTHTYHTFLSWDQAQEMYESGLIQIQHHTFDMHRKGMTEKGEKGLIYGPVEVNGVKETEQQFEQRVSDDLHSLKLMIEQKIGNRVTTLCYPFGSYSPQSEQLARKSGFMMTLTTTAGINTKEQGTYRIKRINVPGTYSGEDIVREIERQKNASIEQRVKKTIPLSP